MEESTVHWEDFLALIKPVYHESSKSGGSPPIPFEELLIDTPCLHRCAWIEAMEGQVHRAGIEIQTVAGLLRQHGPCRDQRHPITQA